MGFTDLDATMKKYVDRATELRLSQSIIAHVQIDGNGLDAQEQRQLHQHLNSRTARSIASNTANRAFRQQRQSQLSFRPT